MARHIKIKSVHRNYGPSALWFGLEAEYQERGGPNSGQRVPSRDHVLAKMAPCRVWRRVNLEVQFTRTSPDECLETMGPRDQDAQRNSGERSDRASPRNCPTFLPPLIYCGPRRKEERNAPSSSPELALCIWGPVSATSRREEVSARMVLINSGKGCERHGLCISCV